MLVLRLWMRWVLDEMADARLTGHLFSIPFPFFSPSWCRVQQFFVRAHFFSFSSLFSPRLSLFPPPFFLILFSFLPEGLNGV